MNKQKQSQKRDSDEKANARALQYMASEISYLNGEDVDINELIDDMRMFDIPGAPE